MRQECKEGRNRVGESGTHKNMKENLVVDRKNEGEKDQVLGLWKADEQRLTCHVI